MLLTGSQLVITWVDMFEDELNYRVERRVGEGSWELVDTLRPMEGGETFWVRTVPASARYRVMATLEERSLPLHSPGNETEIAIDLAPSNPVTIQIDQAEPIRGAARVSVQDAESALSVSYSLDGTQFARVTGGGTFAATLPAQQLVDGTRQLRAFVEMTPGLRVAWTRALQVDNPAAAILFHLVAPSPTPAHPLQLVANASSDAGIASVEFFINGSSVHVASAPSSGSSEYVYDLDTTTLPPGVNVFRVVATDNATGTAEVERTYTVDAPATFDVTGLFDGMITSGDRVSIRGDFSDDLPGANLTIDAGDLGVLRTQTSPFAVDFALAGVPPGEHSVSIRLQDGYGRMTSRYYNVIVPSTSLSYELLARDAEQLLAADRGSLLYRKASGAVVLRNPAGVETQFPAATFGSATYRMSEGRIVAYGQNQRIYLLDASGQATDISQSPIAPAFTPTNLPRLRGPWLSWVQAGAPTMFRVYNLQTGISRDVPVGNVIAGGWHDIVATPGNEQLLFETTLNGTAGIYSHNLQTNVTQLLVSGSVTRPTTDGMRLIWLDPAPPTTELFIAPLSNPAAAAMLSSDVRVASLEGGVVYWIDRDNTLQVNDGSVTTELIAQDNPYINWFTIRNGRVTFTDGTRMHTWSSANGTRLWLDTLPSALMQADGVAYFRTGSSGTLYRVALP